MGIGEESVGILLGFVRIELREGDAGMVVNGDKQDFPAGAARTVSPVSRRTMAGGFNAPELLGIDMQ